MRILFYFYLVFVHERLVMSDFLNYWFFQRSNLGIPLVNSPARNPENPISFILCFAELLHIFYRKVGLSKLSVFVAITTIHAVFSAIGIGTTLLRVFFHRHGTTLTVFVCHHLVVFYFLWQR